MSRRREQIERNVEKEEERLDKQLKEGRITQYDYDSEIRDLHKEAQEDARAAREEDIYDAIKGWE